MFHTIGQRKGLGIGGLKDRNEYPWYVTEKDHSQNILIVAQGNDHTSLYSSRLRIQDCIWVAGEYPELPLSCKAKIRYRQIEQECELVALNNSFEARFSAPQRAVTPGQSIVFYKQDQCLGGGIIEVASN